MIILRIQNAEDEAADEVAAAGAAHKEAIAIAERVYIWPVSSGPARHLRRHWSH